MKRITDREKLGQIFKTNDQTGCAFLLYMAQTLVSLRFPQNAPAKSPKTRKSAKKTAPALSRRNWACEVTNISLFLHHKDDEYKTYLITASIDKEGDLRIEFRSNLKQIVGSETAYAYMRPDLARKLRDDLNALLPVEQPAATAEGPAQ